MINNTKFKKNLHILKQNTDDANISVCIIDYDISRECDYEVLTLHLKETNTQNQASIEKDFIIRSQLYYDVEEDRYLSALDGDIIVKQGVLTQIDILSFVTDLKLSDDFINIKAKLFDKETLEPIKNQNLFLYLSENPLTAMATATTDKNGLASFNFSLKNSGITNGEKLLYIEYKGNTTYRAVKSNYIPVNIINELEENLNLLESNIQATLNTNNTMDIRYNIGFANQNLTDGFRMYSGLDDSIEIIDTQLLSGIIRFYIDNILVGQVNGLSNESNISYAELSEVTLKQEFFDKDIIIQAVYEGNEFFPLNVANLITNLSRITPENQSLIVTQLNNNTYQISLTFSIPKTPLSSNIFVNNQETSYWTNSSVVFFIFDPYENDWKIINNNTNNALSIEDFVIEEENEEEYIISITPAQVNLIRDNYHLDENTPFRVKAMYEGNSFIEGFEVESVRGFDFDIHVTDARDNAISNTTVLLGKIDDSDNTNNFVSQFEQTTNNEGIATFNNIPFGRYILTTLNENYLSYTTILNINQSNTSDQFNITLVPSDWSNNTILSTSDLMITVNVRDTLGNVLSEAIVSLYDTNDNLITFGQTNQDGLYMIMLNSIDFPLNDNADIVKDLCIKVTCDGYQSAQTEKITNIKTGKMITFALATMED